MAWQDFDISDASYDSKSVAGEDTQLYGVTFKPDGTKMYTIGTSDDTVFEFDLSTAWDISTASKNSNEFSVGGSGSGQDFLPRGVAFKTDGTKMYIAGGTNSKVFQYALSTAWDVSSASYDSKELDTDTPAGRPQCITFTDDGTKMLTVDAGSDAVWMYTLSTAWDISTATIQGFPDFEDRLQVGSQDTDPMGASFNDDGTKLWLTGIQNGGDVYQYSLSTPYLLSSATYDNDSFTVSEGSQPRGIFFKPDDGTKMYIANDANNTVFQYTTHTISPVSAFLPQIIMG